MKVLFALLSACFAFALVSCKDQQVQVQRESGFESFLQNYNNHINEWLAKKLDGLDKREVKLREKLAASTKTTEKNSLEQDLKELSERRAMYQSRQQMGEYFQIKTESDLPTDLVWEDGMDNPIIGDPRAKKGGTFHTFIADFPSTLRPIGPNANHGYRGYIYDDIDMSLVNLHPLTNKFIPGLAKEWALGNDGRTVFFRLDPDATYSDGVQVRAKDFMFGMYIRLSDNISAPYEKQYYKEEIANVTLYGDGVLSVSVPETKPMLPYFCAVAPAPPHFYAEYGPDYKDRYQWRVPPTTGGYTLLPENVKKGRSFTMTRVKDWWAKDKKFYKYSCNVDKIHYQVIADVSKAFELFLLGDLDTFPLGIPDYWYDKMEVPEYFNGYIEKVQFYNVYPRVPRGFYLNVAKKPLDDLNVRLGLAHSFDFKKANTVLLRGDAERLNHVGEGYDRYTNPNIEARDYSVAKAAEYFAKAGYTKRDSDGYWVNAKGKRLRVEVTWSKGNPVYDQMLDKMKESTKKAGVEIILDGQQSSVAFSKMLEKRHQMAFLGWSVTPPFPRYYQMFHSKNAYDAQGNLKTQTNNMNSYSDPEMDKQCEIVRSAKTVEELEQASWKVQQIAHDQGLFIPAFKTGYIRMGNWRWVKWPHTQLYEFCSPTSYLPEDSYLYWIDEEEKQRTLEARKKGEVFPERNLFFDLYRKGISSLEELENREMKKN